LKTASNKRLRRSTLWHADGNPANHSALNSPTILGKHFAPRSSRQGARISLHHGGSRRYEKQSHRCVLRDPPRKASIGLVLREHRVPRYLSFAISVRMPSLQYLRNDKYLKLCACNAGFTRPTTYARIFYSSTLLKKRDSIRLGLLIFDIRQQ